MSAHHRPASGMQVGEHLSHRSSLAASHGTFCRIRPRRRRGQRSFDPTKATSLEHAAPRGRTLRLTCPIRSRLCLTVRAPCVGGVVRGFRAP
jgi:hypothetical protein